MYKQCDDKNDDDTVIASNCTDDNADSDTAITQPMSESEAEEVEFLVKALLIGFVNDRDNNQY